MKGITREAFICKAVEEYADMILRIAFQYTQNRQDAEDIMQEVFLSLMKHGDFNSQEHQKAWLIRVTVNKCKDLLRRLKIRQNAHYCGVSSYGMSQDDLEVLDEVNKLPPLYRSVIYLFYYEGYTAKEIAKFLGKRESAVHTALTRARQHLKHFLEV
ncbi:MAG: sigma-70 family RNA polymerase sigma factor [Firmicutes bacterium]|nr:sigma-70 family RNA polymerase sigma factor [Bacillota bacterium]